MKLVLIEWVDSYGCSSSWEKMDVCEPKLLVCRSVGWLLYDGEECKVVVPHVTVHGVLEDQGCGDMTIPVQAITRIVELEKSES